MDKIREQDNLLEKTPAADSAERQREPGYLRLKTVVNDSEPEDWTGINPEKRKPIDKRSPNLTPP